MTTGWKWALGLGSGFLALKLWSDSKRLSDMMRRNPADTEGTVAIGGITYTTPPNTQVPAGKVVNTAAANNQDANKSVSYDASFWGSN